MPGRVSQSEGHLNRQSEVLGSKGWCDGAWQTSSAGASYNLDGSRARAYCTCSRFGLGLFLTFLLSSILSFLSPSLWETARYRLKYCLKGLLDSKPRYNTRFCHILSFLLPPIQEGQLPVTGESMCTKYWLTV